MLCSGAALMRHARVGYMGHLFLMAGALQEAASKWPEACAAAQDATVYNGGFIWLYFIINIISFMINRN